MKAACVVLVAALLFCGCESDEKRYRKVLGKYEALIVANTPVSDGAYDGVLKDLDAMANHEPAQQLAAAIRTLRAPKKLPPRPLAVATDEASDDVERKARECAEHAKTVGLSADGGRDEAMAKLSRCRKELARLDVARIHALDPLAHDGGHQ